MCNIIDGKLTSAKIREEIAGDVAEFCKKYGTRPGLAVVLVGDNPASCVYVRNKKRACEEVGFNSWVWELPSNTSADALDELIDKLNADDSVHGILVQLPLPSHLDEEHVILRIDPKKDVDAFHPYNVGRITIGNPSFLPCTPAGIMELIKRYDIDVCGINVVSLSPSLRNGKMPGMDIEHRRARAADGIVHKRNRIGHDVQRTGM